MRTDFDVAVCGGGVAGAAAAALLSRQGLRVALIDAAEPPHELSRDDFDPRVVAVSPGSIRILEAAGGWPILAPDRAAPYRRMSVHCRSQALHFEAAQHGLDALGWIVEISALRQALWRRIQHQAEVAVMAPTRLSACQLHADRVILTLDGAQTVTAALLVAADGAASRLRSLAGIDCDQWHYNQCALVAPIVTARANRSLAWQRFTDHGPLALLPLADGRSSIVWSQPADRARAQVSMAPDEFLDQLGRWQDSPLGPAESVGARHALPLVRRVARHWYRQRLALLGDAARTVHPLAGQGLNLGLGDAAAMAELLERWDPRQSPASALARYQRWRRSTSAWIGGGIHAINELARLPAPGGPLALGLALGGSNRLWPLKELLAQRACGIDSDSPKLARQARTA